MKQACENCGYFICTIPKATTTLTRLGLCNKHHHKAIDRDETCEEWKSAERRKEARQRISLETLETAVTYIKEISQILKENG